MSTDMVLADKKLKLLEKVNTHCYS